MAPTELAVSIVVPTIGRTARLRACLDSIFSCAPGAAEVLVVDQSGLPEVRDEVRRYAARGARLVECDGRGVSRGMNRGLREARFDVVLVTHDDCTVDGGWVAAGAKLIADAPGAIVTGRVLPAGEPEAVPSTKSDLRPMDYSGTLEFGVIFPNNMVVDRTDVFGIGGFDERFGPDEPAEDCDFCFRWLRAGHGLRYEPGLVVWHHDWRTPEALHRLYLAYAHGRGAVYAKHLRRGDPWILRFVARDVFSALRHPGTPRSPMAYPSGVRSLAAVVGGMRWGWHAFRDPDRAP